MCRYSEEFTQALRMGRVNYLPEGAGERRRVGPDPELPFGNPGAVAQGGAVQVESSGPIA